MKPVQPKPYLQSVNPYTPGRPIEEIQARFSDRKVIKLASNESPLPPSPKVREVVLRQLDELHRYPDGGAVDLRAALADWIGVPAEQIVVGNGSNELIELLVQAFVGTGEQLFTSEGTFAVYPLAARVRGASAVLLPMRDLHYDLQAFHNIPESGGLVCIADPNNPTGTVCDWEQLCALFEARPDLFFLYDAAYEEYRQPSRQIDWNDFSRTYPNVFVVRTFSKAFGLAGLRVGYGFGSPSVADALNRIRQPFNVNRLAQMGAMAALQDLPHMQRMVELNNRMRTELYQFCDRFGLQWQASHTNFVLFAVPNAGGTGVAPADFWADQLLQEGIIVRSMSSFGLPGYLRVNTGTEIEMATFFLRFEQIWQRLGL